MVLEDRHRPVFQKLGHTLAVGAAMLIPGITMAVAEVVVQVLAATVLMVAMVLATMV